MHLTYLTAIQKNKNVEILLKIHILYCLVKWGTKRCGHGMLINKVQWILSSLTSMC